MTEARARTIQQAFEAFHRENPQVYMWLVRQARRARAKGYECIGIALLFETWRWHLMMTADDPSQGVFVVNNDYRSRYARLIMEREPDLAGVFRLRELRSHGPTRLYTDPGYVLPASSENDGDRHD